MRAIQVSHFGGPDVLEVVDIPPPVPGPGEILVEVANAGVNFRDLLHRTGQFGATLPFVPGTEGSGRVVQLGTGSKQFRIGERVAWKMGPSYCELAVVPENETVHVPDEVDDEQAAGLILQGLTAHFLANTTFPVAEGDLALVHAGAGGVGSLLSQMIKFRGGRVIATVSTQAKVAVAEAAGAENVIVYGDGGEDFGPALKELSGGQGVDVVYDGVGRTTFDASLASCKTRGMLVLYGGSSGSVPPFDIMRLMHSGSIVLTRPSVRDFTASRNELDQRTAELFAWVASGVIQIRMDRYSLDNAGLAQAALESRSSTGKIILTL